MLPSPMRRIRPGLVAALLASLALSACSPGSGGSATPAPAPGETGSTATADRPWPMKTRFHVDLWLHGFAMVQDDTAMIPYFQRGYRDQLVVRRNQAGVTTQLDQNRDRLRTRLAANPGLINAQFLILDATSWDEMRQVADLFLKAEGDPRRASDQGVAQAIYSVAQYFPTAADREWLRLFMQGLEDERAKFYQAYWNDTQRERAPVLAATDSVWQQVARPPLQAFLRNTQQANGEILLSLPLDGEGRSSPRGKRNSIVAVTFPARVEDAAHASYVFVHEASLAIANAAVNDNITPTQRREGLAERYGSAAAVVAGRMVLIKLVPRLADGYARYYLRSAGRTAPAGDPGAAFDAAFPLPAAIRDAMQRQVDVTLGGI